MNRPSFQFYPADWRNNANLRRCSEAARGAWMDVLCVLHDSNEYGVCRWPLAELARAAGVPLKLLRELADKQVLKGSDSDSGPYIYTPRHAGMDGAPIELLAVSAKPCWYSSRLVRDEYLRERRGASTRFISSSRPSEKPKQRIGVRVDNPVDWWNRREEIFAKTNGHCYHCKNSLGSNSSPWQVDHLVPRSKGGTSRIENMVPSCMRCNNLKGDTMPTTLPWHGDGLGDGPSSSSSSSDNTPLAPKGASVGDGSQVAKKEPAPKGPLQIRAERIMRRRLDTPLTASEERAFKKNREAIKATTEEDWLALEAFYAAPQPETFSRKDLAALVNNWNGEIDRAKSWAEDARNKTKTTHNEPALRML